MLAATESAPLHAVETRQERHGRDEIIITTYALQDEGYSYSVQCRIGRLVRAVFPPQIARTFATPLEAKRAAVAELRQWTSHSRSLNARLRCFSLLAVEQREFDFGES